MICEETGRARATGGSKLAPESAVARLGPRPRAQPGLNGVRASAPAFRLIVASTIGNRAKRGTAIHLPASILEQGAVVLAQTFVVPDQRT
jgi:hypothetical protein